MIGEAHSNEPSSGGLRTFAWLLAGLAGLSLALAFAPIPPPLVRPVAIVVGVVFIALPVYAIFRAASHTWTPKLAWSFIGVGVVMHVGLTYMSAITGKGVVAAILAALGQTGLMVWCVGLGALLTTLLKEKNLLLPVSLFLASIDIFLVLTPIGPTKIILQVAPNLLNTIAWHVPKVQENPTFGPVAATAHIGPADFLFMAMFFVAIFRFQMRAKQTLMWLAPTLLAYMLIVMFAGPLPALVPIGLCVLTVNFKEFKLSKEEWASTGLVVAIGIGLIAFGATRPKPQVEILPQDSSQGASAPEGSPEPEQAAKPR